VKGSCCIWILLLLLSAFPISAQEEINATATIESAAQFVEENAEVLDAAGIDVELTRKFIGDLNTRFQGTYVYDLGALNENAREWIPILEQSDLTSDYAAWLKSRLDYFEVAEQLRKQAAAQVTNKTANVRLPKPTVQVERKAWLSVVEKKPVPPAAQKHLPTLKRIFAEEKVPTELVWVAEVESSFNSSARSPVGAAGLFQLMPTTAKRFDLSTGFLGMGDERTDTEKSGRAAARYLRLLYQKFGDWRLALAAYNAGEGRVSELLRKQKAKSYDAIADRLPAETQMYVPKIEATLRKREGVSLSDLKMPKA
jgi:membrane-bound lytic murein transglycosylase D